VRDFLILAIHLVVTFAKLLRPGGVRAVAAESLLLKHQLLISNRSRQRAPNLTSVDRLVLGLATLFVRPHRLPKLGALVKPATLLKFHKALVDRKYCRLFSSRHRRRKPGPKGPSAALIAAIVELKRRNPRFGCMRIAQQIAHAFGIELDKDVVRRVLATHYRPDDTGTDGPSWLTFIAHAKESLWSADLFRCESILLRSHWVLLVMDAFSRRIIGFGVERGYVDGISVCRIFNHAIAGKPLPRHLSTDHDPLFRFHRWLANLRVLEIDEIKSIRPRLSSLRRAPDRDDPARVPGPLVFLERGRPGAKAGGIPGLLQRRTRSSRARRIHTGAARRRTLPRSRCTGSLRLAAALPGSVSDPDRCLTTISLPTGPSSASAARPCIERR